MNKDTGLTNMRFDEMADWQPKLLAKEASWPEKQEDIMRILRESYLLYGGYTDESLEECLRIMGEAFGADFAGVEAHELVRRMSQEGLPVKLMGRREGMNSSPSYRVTDNSITLNGSLPPSRTQRLKQAIAAENPQMNRKQRRALLAKARKAK